MRVMDLTRFQWELVREHIPVGKSGKGKSGRPSRAARDVLNGVLWVLRTGAPWHDLPVRYPSYQTCHRRFQSWVESGVMQTILKSLWADLRERGGVSDIEGFIDGTYIPAKKKGIWLANAVVGTRRRSWQLQTAMVFHSLSLLPAEISTKQSLSIARSKLVSLTDSRGNLSQTKLTTVLRLFADSRNNEI